LIGINANTPANQLGDANFPTQLPRMTVDINANSLADAFTRPLAMHTMPSVQQYPPLALMATHHPSLQVMAILKLLQHISLHETPMAHFPSQILNNLYQPSQLLQKFSPPLTSMERGYKIPYSSHAIIDCEDQSVAVEVCTLSCRPFY